MSVPPARPPLSLRCLQPQETGPLIRLGRDNDGGYVIPGAALAPSKLLLGIGIHDDWSFEQDFKRLRPEARVVGVDGSAGLGLLLWRSFPRIFQIIGAGLMLDFKRVAKKWAYFHKVPDFIRFFGREIFLRKMLVARPMPGGITLTELFQSYGPVPAAKPDVFVKIDIEGAEYAVLREVGPLLGRISCLVVEFHDLANHWDGLLDTAARLAPDFAVAHVHGNNYEFLLPGTGIPNALEVTWLNRQLAPAPITPSPLRYPLADLDQPCNARAPDYELNFD